MARLNQSLLLIGGITAGIVALWAISRAQSSQLTLQIQQQETPIRQEPHPLTLQEILIQKAIKAGHLREDLTVRGISPSDFSLSTETWSVPLTSTGWNTVINTDVSHDTWIGIDKLVYSGSKITQIRFRTGASTIGLENIESVGAFTTAPLADIVDIIYEPNQRAQIDYYATATSTGETLSYLGYVVEPRGKTIA